MDHYVQLQSGEWVDVTPSRPVPPPDREVYNGWGSPKRVNIPWSDDRIIYNVCPNKKKVKTVKKENLVKKIICWLFGW